MLAITGYYNRNFQRKTLPRVRIIISQKKDNGIEDSVIFIRSFIKQSPKHLNITNHASNRSYFTRSVENVPCFKVRHDFFKNLFFPSTVTELRRLAKVFKNQKVFILFKKAF